MYPGQRHIPVLLEDEDARAQFTTGQSNVGIQCDGCPSYAAAVPPIETGRWPKGIIDNADMCVRCDTGPLSQQVQRMRRSMFGHVLRMPEDTPAQMWLLD